MSGPTLHRPDARTAWDAVVVGARVAGASTALLLARAGLRVLVVDRARRGSDTLSTHALMRGGVLQLRRWGVLDRVAATGVPGVRRVTFHYGGDPVLVTLKPSAGVDALCAPRRTVLDAGVRLQRDRHDVAAVVERHPPDRRRAGRRHPVE